MPETTTVGPYTIPAELQAEVDRALAAEKDLAARVTALEQDVVPPEPPDTTEKLYVAPTGSNSNNGTIDHPFRDVNEALKRLGPHVSVNIRAGTYAEEIISPNGGTSLEPAIVRAYQGERVVLQPPSGRSRCITLENARSHDIEFEDLHLDGKNVQYDVVKLTYGGTDKANTAHHITLRRCELMNAIGQGILSTAESHHNLFEDCVIHDIALQSMSDLAHGFYICGADNILRNVEVFRCAGSAGQNYCSYGPTANRNLYEDCYFHDCQLGGPQKRPMLSMASGSGCRIVNTRMVGGQYAKTGVDFMGSCTDFEIAGGSIEGFPLYGILIEPGATRTKVTNVSYSQNGTNLVNQGNGSIITPSQRGLSCPPKGILLAALGLVLGVAGLGVEAARRGR